MSSNWKRVSKEHPCPVCEKPDWCMVAADDSAAICARVQSDHPAGTKGAGWVHQLQVEVVERPRWRAVKRAKREHSTKNHRAIAENNCKALRSADVEKLALELGVSKRSLMLLGVGWSEAWGAFSFPMRYPSGNVSGIRYRSRDDRKFSEPGSRDGMFFRPDQLSAAYVILVEGASDAAAVIDLGFNSVLGRASCRGNVDQILTLCRRLRPKQILLIPDNDDPGIAGAEDLCAKIRAAGGTVQILNLKDGVKDVRQCVQNPENASWLAGEISEATRYRNIDKQGGVR